eukprot:7187341-Pyramimonas_sp.AAC.1
MRYTTLRLRCAARLVQPQHPSRRCHLVSRHYKSPRAGPAQHYNNMILFPIATPGAQAFRLRPPPPPLEFQNPAPLFTLHLSLES